jgi:tetratricopeptide (TPR) repeat protein
VEDSQEIFARFQATTRYRRAQLSGLAMLRSLRYQGHVAQVLGASPKLSVYLKYLYGELFTDQREETFWPEIRTPLRRSLLANRSQSEVQNLAQNILAKQQDWFSTRENNVPYGGNLSQRLENADWCECFLDVLEAYYWDDPDQGVRYALPCFLAASLYHPAIMLDIIKITAFFEEYLSDTMRGLWTKIRQGFGLSRVTVTTIQRLECLEQIRASLQQETRVLPEIFMPYRAQLLGALWWQAGEFQRKAQIDDVALEAYGNALRLLYDAEKHYHYAARLYYIFARQMPEHEQETRVCLLQRAIASDPGFAEAYGELGDFYRVAKDYQRAFLYYHHAIELKITKVEAWINLGSTYVEIGKYAEAIEELTRALSLDADDPYLYYNRARALQQQGQFKEALLDLDKALDPDLGLSDEELADIYVVRGNIHAMDNAVEQATRAYQQALQLAPDNMQARWLCLWMQFGKRRPKPAEMHRLQELADLQPELYLAALCRGLYAGIVQHDLQQACIELENAQRQEEQQWDGPFWLALLHAYRRNARQAIAFLQQALNLGLPVALLRPLYWLEADSPDIFQQVAVPLLQKYGIS